MIADRLPNMTFCGPARDTVLTNRQTEKLNFDNYYITNDNYKLAGDSIFTTITTIWKPGLKIAETDCTVLNKRAGGDMLVTKFYPPPIFREVHFRFFVLNSRSFCLSGAPPSKVELVDDEHEFCIVDDVMTGSCLDWRLLGKLCSLLFSSEEIEIKKYSAKVSPNILIPLQLEHKTFFSKIMD